LRVIAGSVSVNPQTASSGMRVTPMTIATRGAQPPHELGVLGLGRIKALTTRADHPAPACRP